MEWKREEREERERGRKEREKRMGGERERERVNCCQPTLEARREIEAEAPGNLFCFLVYFKQNRSEVKKTEKQATTLWAGLTAAGGRRICQQNYQIIISSLYCVRSDSRVEHYANESYYKDQCKLIIIFTSESI